MKANEFIKKAGLNEVKRLLSTATVANDNQVGVIPCNSWTGIPIDIGELKRLIESHDFAEQVEGLETVRTMIKTMDEHNLKKMPTSFNGDSLGCFTRDYFVQVVRDVESCQ